MQHSMLQHLFTAPSKNSKLTQQSSQVDVSLPAVHAPNAVQQRHTK
jgi:hypothetical protein